MAFGYLCTAFITRPLMSSITRGEAYYYISPSHDPFYNIALEDYLYRRLTHLDCIYMLWVNSPAVFMGRYQSAQAETDWAYVLSAGIPILRRTSGGGTVYHDLGNLCYTCIARDITGRGHSLPLFPQPIVSALSSKGVELVRSPRGDLRYKGLKVAGAAEASRSGRMLYHMCLLFDTDLGELERVLRVPETETARSRVPSVRSQVTNLSQVITEHSGETMSLDDFEALLLTHIAQRHSALLPLELGAEADDYIEERIQHFASPEWIHAPIGLAPITHK